MLDVRAGGLLGVCGLLFEAIGCGLAGEGDGKGDGFLAGFFRWASVFFAGGCGAGAAVGGSFRKGMEIKGMPGTGAGVLDRINGIHWISRSRRGELAGGHGGHFVEALGGPADVAVKNNGFLDCFGLGGEFPGFVEGGGEAVATAADFLWRCGFFKEVAAAAVGLDVSEGGIVAVNNPFGSKCGSIGHGEFRLGGFGRGG